MTKPLDPAPSLATPRDDATNAGGDGGSLRLGSRRFVIVAASDLRPHDNREQLCEFDLIGNRLFVFETSPSGLGTGRARASGVCDDLTARLTGRELQIAILVAQGLATKNIAYRLQISEWTVATYLRRIFAKLDVDSRAAMVFRCAPLINASLTFDRARGPDVAFSSICRVTKS